MLTKKASAKMAAKAVTFAWESSAVAHVAWTSLCARATGLKMVPQLASAAWALDSTKPRKAIVAIHPSAIATMRQTRALTDSIRKVSLDGTVAASHCKSAHARPSQ